MDILTHLQKSLMIVVPWVSASSGYKPDCSDHCSVLGQVVLCYCCHQDFAEVWYSLLQKTDLKRCKIPDALALINLFHK